jgi:hypothetical protein
MESVSGSVTGVADSGVSSGRRDGALDGNPGAIPAGLGWDGLVGFEKNLKDTFYLCRMAAPCSIRAPKKGSAPD